MASMEGLFERLPLIRPSLSPSSATFQPKRAQKHSFTSNPKFPKNAEATHPRNPGNAMTKTPMSETDIPELRKLLFLLVFVLLLLLLL